MRIFDKEIIKVMIRPINSVDLNAHKTRRGPQKIKDLPTEIPVN